MFSKKSFMKRGVSLAMATTLFISVFPLNASAAAFSNDDRIIVSLGDSFSAGEGVEKFYGQDKPWEERVKDPDWLAHRSEQAWPGKLTLAGVKGTMAENRNTHWYFAAVSGAETTHLEGIHEKDYYIGEWVPSTRGFERFKLLCKGYEFLPPQLQIFYEIDEGRTVDYVTITIGGNNVGFGDVVKKAAVGSTSILGTLVDPNALAYELSEAYKDVYREVVKESRNEGDLIKSLRAAYKAIEKAAPEAHIIVVGYPELFDSYGKGLLISKDEADMVNDAVRILNTAIHGLVLELASSDMKISFVSVEEAFQDENGKSRGAYSEEPLITEISLLPRGSTQDLDMTALASAYSMHPNLSGIEVYAQCVQREIDRLEAIRMFTETKWIWSRGTEDVCIAHFHNDDEAKAGLLDYYDMTGELLGSQTYTYEDSRLIIDGCVYKWSEGKFVAESDYGPANPNIYLELIAEDPYSDFVDQMKAEYGTASRDDFISCIGTAFQEYPDTIKGFITSTTIDLDSYGTDEYLALISDGYNISLQIYSANNGEYALSCEAIIAGLDCCMEQMISLHYQSSEEKYVLFVDGLGTGAYTGNDFSHAALYYVEPNAIEPCCTAGALVRYADNEMQRNDLLAFDVPYAQYYASIDNITQQSRYRPLLKINHRYINADEWGGWEGREHYLQLATE